MIRGGQHFRVRPDGQLQLKNSLTCWCRMPDSSRGERFHTLMAGMAGWAGLTGRRHAQVVVMRRNRVLNRWLLICLFSLGVIAPARAGDRLLATGGVSQVEGAGGGGLVPWALIAGYGTRAISGLVAELHDHVTGTQNQASKILCASARTGRLCGRRIAGK